jgi:DtxR family transcriptional regulator, Mn-dependent transcriptional regulator
MEIELSRSERELLKELYRQSRDQSGAHTSGVADRLGVTPGTVTIGVKRLADRGLVIHRPYKDVELTAHGTVLAISVIRRHRIVECFLAQMLGYEWQDADRHASQFEHHIPQEVEDRLFGALGEPETCPHGFPIPAPESSHLPTPQRLTDLEPGEDAVVALPGNTGRDTIDYLESLGIRPGAHIELREKQPFDGPVVLRVNGTDQTVGEKLAQRIHVLPTITTDEAAS